MATTESDRRLIQRTLAGERDAFGVLVERYGPLIHGLILEKARCPDEVEDLVQVSFSKAYEQLSTLRKPRLFAAWLRRIAGNEAVEWLRARAVRQRQDVTAEIVALYDPVRSPGEIVERDDTFAKVWEAIDHLQPELRQVIVLRYMEGCSQRDTARFLGVSPAAIHWRLFRARNRLGIELAEALRESVRPRRDERVRREKIVAALPLVVFFRPDVPAALSRWARRALAGIGVAGTLGLLGVVIDRARLSDMRMAREREGGYRVVYEPQELPAISFSVQPRAPQAGERVELEVAGFQPGDGESAFLHYITDFDEPIDRVVEMRPSGETWAAELTIPAGAADVFFYVNDDREPLRYSWDGPWWDEFLRYSSALMVYDEAGRPVRGAELGIGKWAGFQRRPIEEILGHCGRELSLYPDQWEAYRRRWVLLQWPGDLPSDKRIQFERIQREKEVLRRRFPDNPDVAQLVINDWDTSRLRAFATRFPKHEKAAGSAYRATLRPFDDLEGRTVALQRFLQDFPQSPYIDDAYRDLLHMYDRIDRDRGKALADSLIDGDLVPYFDLERERVAERIQWSSNWEGALPEGKAYFLRFKWYVEEGDTTAATLLARRLAESGLRDPIPFVAIGRQLVDGSGHGKVAEDLLRSGLRWLTEEHMLQLPTFVVHSHRSMLSEEFARRILSEEVLTWRVKCLHALGEICLGRGDHRAAALHLGEAAELQKELTRTWPEQDIYMKLGEAGEALGDCAGAIDAYLEAVRINYHHPGAEAALRRLLREECGQRGTLEELLASVYTEAPDFRAADVYDDSLGLTDFRGSVVAMYRGDSHWGEHRAKELDVLDSWHDRFHSAGLQVIYLAETAVSFPSNGEPPYRTRDQMTAAVRERGYSFTVAFGDGPNLGKYRSLQYGRRVLFLIDRIGRLRMRQARAWDDAEVEAQNREALGFVAQLLAEPVSSASLSAGIAEVHDADRASGLPQQAVEAAQ